jgi:tuberculosinol/isotuberculosinol synthase
MTLVDLQTFQNLSNDEVARLVRGVGPKVCVFPINGTRRWFMLEHPEQAATGSLEAYLRIGGHRHVELYRMFFDHGLDTLLTPVFGPDLLERGPEYGQVAVQGLLWFAQSPQFLDFYDRYQVRVRVYGDAERHFWKTPYEPALRAFDELVQRTASHQGYRLFFGVCAHDATETVAQIGVRFYQEQGRLPDRHQIVEAYYGEYVDPVDLFIGFERPSVFDMPLIATGNEDLYFTVSPSPYLTPACLRSILYDHLYARRVDDADYGRLSPGEWSELGDFYTLNRESVLGLGCRLANGKFWSPLPQVKRTTNTE